MAINHISLMLQKSETSDHQVESTVFSIYRVVVYGANRRCGNLLGPRIPSKLEQSFDEGEWINSQGWKSKHSLYGVPFVRI